MFQNKWIYLLSLIGVSLYGSPKLLLLCGPSGVGKTTIITELKKKDPRFQYITPYTTRSLREGECDKVHVSYEEMLNLHAEGKLVVLNNLYGNLYGTPRHLIEKNLSKKLFPVLDWPIDLLYKMEEAFGEDIFVVYVFPKDAIQLQSQLQLDKRDPTGDRAAKGMSEIAQFQNGAFSSQINFSIENLAGQGKEVASQIYSVYLRECGAD